MTIDPANPIWTAYLVGELTGEEQAEIETLLAASPEAQALVAQLRGTIDAVSLELAAEPMPTGVVSGAEGSGNEVVAAMPVIAAASVAPRRQSHKLAWSMAISLVLIIAVGLMLPNVQSSRSRSRQTADAATNRERLASAAPNHQSANGSLSATKSSNETKAGGKSSYVVAKPTYETRPDGDVSIIVAKPTYENDEQTERSATLHKNESGIDDLAEGISGPQPGQKSLSTNNPMDSEYRLELLSKGGASANFGAVERAFTGPQHRSSPAPADVKNPFPVFSTDLDMRFRLGEGVSPNGADGASTSTVADLNGTLGGAGTLNVSGGTQLATGLDGGRGPLNIKGDAIASKSEGERRSAIGGFSELSSESQGPGTESYEPVTDNPFRAVLQEPLSTFSIDVDTASFANVRRFITQNRRLPPPAAVRIEELVNYFHYDYPQPDGEVPFSVHTEVAGCPWSAGNRLVKIGLKGREIARESRPNSNLVFLVDVSGSMNEPNKLPLVKDALKLLVGQLGESDRVAMVVYAGNSGLVLPSTNGMKSAEIRAAIDRLEAGGSTNGGAGIQLAYETALQNFIAKGNNRVILATDGDFNVGITSRDELVKFVAGQAKSGVYLTTLGFGFGNLKDNMLEQLADKGNGNYAYIDDLREAHKVLVEEMSGTLVAIAKDVKIQIEFNPAHVAAFRLVGYENRMLAHKDFNDDTKDAGEIGAGHTVTALYEIVPVGGDGPRGAGADEPRTGQTAPAAEPLKYQRILALTDEARGGELLTVNLRYKDPEAAESKKLTHAVKDLGLGFGQASRDFQFASAVASFGMLLRHSPYRGASTFSAVIELAEAGRGSDPDGRRAEFIALVRQAAALGN